METLESGAFFHRETRQSLRRRKKGARLREEIHPAAEPEEAGEQDAGRRVLCEAFEENSAASLRTFKPADLSGFQIAAGNAGRYRSCATKFIRCCYGSRLPTDHNNSWLA